MIEIQIKKNYLADYLNSFPDMHSHIIPGIDDGVNNTKHAIYIIRRLLEFGVNRYTATPHIMADVYPNTPETINKALTKLNIKLNEQNLEHVLVKAAAEYMLDSNFDSLLDTKELLTLNNEKYLLVELSYFQPPINLENTIRKIVSSGYKPVLAHPERYSFYHNNFDYYKKLKEIGCAFQVNVLSLSNYYGKNVRKTTFRLLNEGLIDFMGTDIHHAYHTRELTNMVVSKKTIKLLTPIIENTKEKFSF